MGNRLRVEIKEDDALTYVILAGVIDEDNDLTEVTPRVRMPSVAINTAAVERINSCGVRDWVKWLDELRQRGAQNIYLVECSPVIMSQVNLVHNFVGSGAIVDFYGPYYCTQCDTNSMLIINVDEARQSLPFKAPACRCNRCDLPLEFDDIESSYFAFLATVQRPRLDPALLQNLKRFSPSTEAKMRARSNSVSGIPTLSSAGSFPTSSLRGSPEAKSLFSGASLSSKTPDGPAPSAYTTRVLIVVIALLVASIGLLTFVILKTH
jgi:anti-anti-sigma regulatory factor